MKLLFYAATAFQLLSVAAWTAPASLAGMVTIDEGREG